MKKGFTLIEMCVVIAIIAILLTLFIPLLTGRYKDVCLSGVAYIQDTRCANCPLVVKVDAQTMQPTRCPVEKAS